MADRGLTGAMDTAVAAGTNYPVLLVEIGFDDGASPPGTSTVRLTSSHQEISWDSKTWTATGDLLSVTPAPETSAVRATGAQITLTGIDTAYISLALSSIRQGKACTMWLAFLDAPGGSVIADPYKFFDGEVDNATIREGSDTATVTIRAESNLAALRRANRSRFTSEDLKEDFPGDKFFDFARGLGDWKGDWGKPNPIPKEPWGFLASLDDREEFDSWEFDDDE